MVQRIISVCMVMWIVLSGGLSATYAQEDDPGPYQPVMTLGRGDVYSVAWSPAGDVISVGGAFGVWLYTPDLTDIGLLPSETPIYALAFSPDGTQLVTGGADGWVWDIATQTRLYPLDLAGFEGRISAVDWSSDGQWIAAGGGKDQRTGASDELNGLWLFDAATGQMRHTLASYGWRVFELAFSPDAELLAVVNSSNSAQVWGLAALPAVSTALIPATYEPFADSGYQGGHTLSWSPDSTQLMITDGFQWGDMFAWDRIEDKIIVPPRLDADNNAGAGYAATRVRWSPAGDQIAIKHTFDHSAELQLFDAETFELRADLEPAAQFEWSSDGEYLVTYGATRSRNLNAVQVWRATEPYELLASRAEHGDWNSGVAFAPDGARLLVHADRAEVWNLATGQLELTTGEPGDWGQDTEAINWTLDGDLVFEYEIYGGNCRALAYDGQTGALLEMIWEDGISCRGDRWSPDLQRIAHHQDCHTLIEDRATGTILIDIDQCGGYWPDVWSPDGQLLAIPRDYGTYIVDTVSGARVGEIMDDLGGLIVWSPDNSMLANPDWPEDNITRVWDVRTGEQLFRLEGHVEAIDYIAFHPDGTRLATGARDEGARVWDLTTGEQIAHFTGESGGVAWSPDGELLAIAYTAYRQWEYDRRAGTITLWREASE